MEVIAAGSGLGEGQGGAAGYVEGVIPAMLKDDRITRLTVYVPRWYEPARMWSHPQLRVRRCPVPTSRPARVAFEQIVTPLLAIRDRIDVMFCTGNYRPLAYRRANVLALHAVQHFLLNDDIGRLRSAYLRFAVPRSARTADKVLAVSETLRGDAIQLFRLDPDRIISVPMGPSPWVLRRLDPAERRPDPYRTPDGAPYILAISRLYALKNHRRLIEAFSALIRDHEVPHRLVIVGGDADVTRAELADFARKAGVGDRVMLLGRVPQASVPGLYEGADAVAYVSLYETFGHPVLEAFATSTPLLTSSAGATGEVAGGAARLADPHSVDDIAAGLHEVLTDGALRARLIEAGRRRVTDFSWEVCARRTVDALVDTFQRRSASRDGGSPGHGSTDHP